MSNFPFSSVSISNCKEINCFFYKIITETEKAILVNLYEIEEDKKHKYKKLCYKKVWLPKSSVSFSGYFDFQDIIEIPDWIKF